MDVSVPVISVDADSVDVLIVVSALDAIDVPITMTLIDIGDICVHRGVTISWARTA